MTVSINRRNLLGASITAGLAAAAPAAFAHPAAKMPAKWDETFDVVVIGSGFAGLSAAIEAKTAGANVVVFDQMPIPGGNSIL